MKTKTKHLTRNYETEIHSCAYSFQRFIKDPLLRFIIGVILWSTIRSHDRALLTSSSFERACVFMFIRHRPVHVPVYTYTHVSLISPYERSRAHVRFFFVTDQLKSTRTNARLHSQVCARTRTQQSLTSSQDRVGTRSLIYLWPGNTSLLHSSLPVTDQFTSQRVHPHLHVTEQLS